MTILDIFYERVKKNGEKTAILLKKKGRWEKISWKEFGKRVRYLSIGLSSIGLNKGDRAAILSKNRPEWVFFDLAILSAGGISVPIYFNNIPKQVEHILNDSGSKFVVVEDKEQLRKVLMIKKSLPELDKIILIEDIDIDEDGIIGYRKLYDIGEKSKINFMLNINPDDIATYIYTSGTTGAPKGVILDHRNILFVCKSLEKTLPISEKDITISLLPLAHVFERNGGEFPSIYMGYITAYGEGAISNIKEASPTFVRAVPKIFDKIYSKIISSIEKSSPYKRRLFYWGLSIGNKISKLKTKKEFIPISLRLKFIISDILIFKKIKRALGGKIRFFISGGAPLPRDIAEFFHSIGILILEGYGLTESTVVISVNRPDNFKFGTVGKPIDGVDVRISGDGEILVKGDNVMRGYFNNEDSTKQAINDGWLHTGDIGSIDEDGFLTITDRKKDIIVTSWGKNISPQNIENLFKGNRYISNIMVYGDKKPYLTALITLNFNEIAEYIGNKDISHDELINNRKVIELISRIVEEKNKELSEFERIRKFRILKEDFSIELGELTPTLKIRRDFISKKYRVLIDGMYR
jgi:long-chain acyl-CoA synthetase